MKNKKADILIIAAVLLISVLLLLIKNSSDADTAIITVNGETVKTIDLSHVTGCYTFSLENGIVIEVSENGVAFVESDCNGKDCINCGKLKNPGDTAVCIPNRTVIKISGNRPNLDAVVY